MIPSSESIHTQLTA
jgi:hypothetical protein